MIHPGDDYGDGIPDNEMGETVAEPDSKMVSDLSKRNLDQWCFAEHLEPDVLLQVSELLK